MVVILDLLGLVGERKTKAAVANGNGVQYIVTDLSYTIFNPRVMPFHLPGILGGRAHVPQTVVFMFVVLLSLKIYANICASLLLVWEGPR